jgi:hypothetical protein
MFGQVASDLDEAAIENLIQQIRAVDPTTDYVARGRRLVITPEVIAYFGSIEAALEAAHRILDMPEPARINDNARAADDSAEIRKRKERQHSWGSDGSCKDCGHGRNTFLAAQPCPGPKG